MPDLTIVPLELNTLKCSRTVLVLTAQLVVPMITPHGEQRIIDYVNPLQGAAPISSVADAGFWPPWRVRAGLMFPGTSVPNAMVQLSAVTQFGNGAGCQNEDNDIQPFAQASNEHWNFLYIPILPVSGTMNLNDFGSTFSPMREPSHPGYCQVYLEQYHMNAELTSVLQTGFRCHAWDDNQEQEMLIVNLTVSNAKVGSWNLAQEERLCLLGISNGE